MVRCARSAVPAAVSVLLLVAACGGGGDSLASQGLAGDSSDDGSRASATADSPSGSGGSSLGASLAGEAASPADTRVAEPAAPVAGPASPRKSAGSRPATVASKSAGDAERAVEQGDRETATRVAAERKTSTATGKSQAAKSSSASRAAGMQAGVSGTAEDRRIYAAKNGATDTGVTKDTIKLGSVNMHSMAGGSFLTTPVVRGNLATVTSINDRGGVLGRRMTISDCDSGTGDTARGKACVKKLVEQDGVFSLITGLDWSTASIHQDLRHYELPYVGAWAYSQTEWQDPYMFPTHMSMIHEAMAGANWARDVVRPKTYGLICLTSPEMQLACDQVQKIMDAGGSKLVKRADVAISENTMSPFVVAMRAAAPDHIIHYVINPMTIAKFFLEAEQQNYWPPQGMSGNHLAAEVLGSVWGKFAAGRYWTNTTYKLWGAEFIATMSKYARGNKGANHHIVQAGYVGVNFLAQAAKAAGPNLTREALVAQLRNGEVWRADASLDQKFSYRPSERADAGWSRELGQGREFMYKYVAANTGANPDGSPNGFIPDPDQFVIHTH
jgi:hypothetical protein